MSRRRFNKALLGAAAGVWLSPLALAGRSSASPARELTLTARAARVDLGGGPEFTSLTYDGGLPGPEIRLTEGEKVRIVLKNALNQPTTVHWHGLPVENAMDGVPGVTQAAVPPGESFTYGFTARPAGTFFYHSHVGYQFDQGLYGALVIEPSGPRPGHDREYTLVLEDWVTRDGGGASPDVHRRPPMGHGMMGRRMMGGRGGPLWEPVYDAYAVNGRAWPHTRPLKVRRGDKVLLRLINASSATAYDLALAGHPLTVVAADGNPVRPVEVDGLSLGMGERYDVEFMAGNPGNWLLAARENGLGEGGLKVPLAYEGINPGEPAAPEFRRGMRWLTYGDLVNARPSPPRGAPGRVYRQMLSGGMHSAWWTINGRVHPDSERLEVEKGERVRLEYLNHSPMFHPMHLHGHFFRLATPGLDPELWPLKDTAMVGPMGRLSIEFAADNPGLWFHHCHNLYHMEAGMANLVAYA